MLLGSAAFALVLSASFSYSQGIKYVPPTGWLLLFPALEVIFLLSYKIFFQRQDVIFSSH